MNGEKNDDSHDTLKKMDEHDVAQPGEVLKDATDKKHSAKDDETAATPE